MGGGRCVVRKKMEVWERCGRTIGSVRPERVSDWDTTRMRCQKTHPSVSPARCLLIILKTERRVAEMPAQS